MQIVNLKPGDQVYGRVFAVTGTEHVVKNNFHFLVFSLSDCTGTCAASFLDYSEDNYLTLCQAKLIKVHGEVQTEKKYRGQIKVNKFVVAEVPQDLTPYLQPLPGNHEDVKSRFLTLGETVTDSHLHKLLRRVFDTDKNTWMDFCMACAADKMHHAYRGGLLEHSLEVAELAESICNIVPSLNRDLLIACALLHDIGKLEEMEHGLSKGNYTASGILVGHVNSGAFLLCRYMYGMKNFPAQLIETVTHMIMSHQGTLEFGATRLPAIAEAQVLSQCDMLSARLFQYSEVAVSSQGKLSAWLPGKKEGRAYTGDLGLEKVKAINNMPEPVKEFKTTSASITVASSTFHTIRMRIRGLVAAGSPEQGSAEDEETREVVPPACGADFLVRVTGDSMMDEGIRERDLLFVKVIETPKDGDVVVAHVGVLGEVVKRYRCEPARNAGQEKKWLESENSSQNYPNIPVDNDTRVRGKVVGLIRDF